MKDKITIVNNDGIETEAFLITYLTLEEYKSIYIAYTEHELTDGENEICFAKIREENDQMCLDSITDENELNALLDAFRKESSK